MEPYAIKGKEHHWFIDGNTRIRLDTVIRIVIDDDKMELYYRPRDFEEVYGKESHKIILRALDAEGIEI